MNLSIKDIKQIALEELRNVLSESFYRNSLNLINQRIEDEPQAWKSELKQYEELMGEGMHEEFFSLIEDDPSILAYFIENLDSLIFKVRDEAELFGLLGRSNRHPNLSALIRDYLRIPLNSLTNLMKATRNAKAAGSRLREIQQFLLGNDILRGFLGIREIEVFDASEWWESAAEDDLEDPQRFEREYDTTDVHFLRLRFNTRMVPQTKRRFKLFGINKSDFEKESVDHIRNMWHGGSYTQHDVEVDDYKEIEREEFPFRYDLNQDFTVNRGIDPNDDASWAKVSDYIEGDIEYPTNYGRDGVRYTGGSQLSLGFIANW